MLSAGLESEMNTGDICDGATSPHPTPPHRIFPMAANATAADLRKALQAAHFALIEAADHIRSRGGWSPAYRRVSLAADAAQNALSIHHATPPHYGFS